MNGKTNYGGLGRLGKWAAGLALVAGAGLWSGCDQSDEISAMARVTFSGIRSLSPSDGASSGAVSDRWIPGPASKSELIKDMDRPAPPEPRVRPDTGLVG